MYRIILTILNLIFSLMHFFVLFAFASAAAQVHPVNMGLFVLTIGSLLVPFVCLFLRGPWLAIQLVFSALMASCSIQLIARSLLGRDESLLNISVGLAIIVIDLAVVGINFRALRQDLVGKDLSLRAKLGICALPVLCIGLAAASSFMGLHKRREISKLADASSVKSFIEAKISGQAFDQFGLVLGEYGMNATKTFDEPSGKKISSTYYLDDGTCYKIRIETPPTQVVVKKDFICL